MGVKAPAHAEALKRALAPYRAFRFTIGETPPTLPFPH